MLERVRSPPLSGKAHLNSSQFELMYLKEGNSNDPKIGKGRKLQMH